MSPAPLSSTPDAVADATVAALRAGRGEVWVPRASAADLRARPARAACTMAAYAAMILLATGS